MSEAASSSEGPLYIRWGADRSPFAVELKLDLVRQIRDALATRENAGIEIGGVLVGSLPTAYSSTIRIEEVEMIPRSPQDGMTFMLDQGQQDRFAEVRWRSRDRERTAVGMFRSHVRPGSLGPSLADRTLLTSEFSGPVYALLLVQANAPHSAAFYVASHGQLPVEPSIRSFRFEEAEFRALPEIDPEAAPELPLPAPPPRTSRHWGVPAAVGLAAAIAAVALFLFSDATRLAGDVAAQFGSAERLDLEARRSGRQLRISWNHTSHDLDSATGGTLKIRIQGSEREIKLGVDELRLGSVVFETASSSAEITLAVTVPGASPTTQTVVWTKP